MTMRNMMGAIARFGKEAIGTTAEEVLHNAGLDFEVKIEPLYTSSGKVVRSKFNRVFRTDNDDTLGVVGKTYVPMQNDRLLEIANEVVAKGDIDWHRIGMVGAGEKLFASFKLPEGFTIAGWDDIDQYIYLCNTHDGSGGIRVIPSNLVIGCSNQYSHLLASIKRAGIDPKLLSIRHSGKQEDRVADLVAALRVVDQLNQQFVLDAQELIQVEMSQDDRVSFYLDTFGIKQNEELVEAGTNPLGLTTRGNNTLDKLLEIEAHPTNNHNGNGGSAFAAFNTATYYLDHEWTFDRAGEKSNDKRVESAIMGTGARMKSKAWESLVGEYLTA
jgi:phage/plasmid-like protein (TIGR03299 family)